MVPVFTSLHKRYPSFKTDTNKESQGSMKNKFESWKNSIEV